MEPTQRITHILLIEDDTDDSQLFAEVIQAIDKKIEVTVLNTCNEVPQVLNTLNPLPDLLFLDLNLPGKQGLACISDIKAHPVYKGIKIVVYCGVLSKTIMDKALEKGADGCFVNPSSFQEVQAMLQTILYTA